MTTKPKTRKAPAAAIGINPKLSALAAKIDDAKARFSDLSASADRDRAFMEILVAEAKLDRIAAVNLDELRLKARHRWGFPWPAFCCPDGLPLSYAYPPNLGPAPRRAAEQGKRGEERGTA